MSRLYLVRHGETEWNQEGCIQGSADIPLSAAGETQMRATASFLEELIHEPFHVFTSDLKRCAESAAMITETRRVTTVLTQRLREVDFGSWTGRTVDELRAAPAERRAWDDMSPNYVWGGGESFAIACERAAEAITQHLAITQPRQVIVVTHGLIIQLLLSVWICGSLTCASRFTVSNGSITILDWNASGEASILAANIVPADGIRYAPGVSAVTNTSQNGNSAKEGQ